MKINLRREFIFYSQCLFILLVSNWVFCSKCWVNFDAKQHFEDMDNLDKKYDEARKVFQTTNGDSKLDKEMLVALLKTRGIAKRALHTVKGDPNLIPAGINLGGYCMMKLPDSVLFFHRMKLRNNTVFRITSLKNDLANLQLKSQFQLNDLHLFGSYDLTTSTQYGYLFYEPTFGQIEILLKNVTYDAKGRYRLLKNKLSIELVISEIEVGDILMMYQNKNSTLSIKLDGKSIDIFMERLKLDLDKWIKDYFNDYIMYLVVAEDAEFEKYNQEKTKLLNNYTDKIIDMAIQRIEEVKASAVQLPSFTIVNGIDKEVRLRNGVLRGLDSIYRRSIATGIKEKSIRKIDAVVGFSNLKLTYTYDVILSAGFPPVTGSLILTADELNAHMGLSLLENPETADISFTFLEQAKPESLTVEGPANRMISNFKYLLERHILSIMVNTLIHNIKMLGTIDRCVPVLSPPNSSDSNPVNMEIEKTTELMEDVTKNELQKSSDKENDIEQDKNIEDVNNNIKYTTVNDSTEPNADDVPDDEQN